MEANKKKIFNIYAGFFPTFVDFKNTFEKLANDYSCMVIDNKSNSQITNKVFWYNHKKVTVN